MRQEVLHQLMKRQPCPLLRLHLTGGATFDLSDPDQFIVTRSTVEVLLPRSEAGSREAVINLLHVVWVEVISPDG